MTRRRVLLLGSVAVVAALAVAVWLLWPRAAITPENAARIHEGMTLAEVESILGGPPGAYTTDGQDWSMGMLDNGVRDNTHTRRVWVGDEGGIRIDFNEHERVHVCQWCARSARLWDRIRRYLHL